jgi:hypothetical protein
MRTRKVARPVEDTPPDDMVDPVPADDVSAGMIADDEVPALRVCLACGASELEPVDGCDHPEVALFDAPTRTTRTAVARLCRAISEHRQAERALAAIVATECARGRAMFERRPEPPPPPPSPCPTCLAREERADAEERVRVPRARPARRRATGTAEQMPLAFATADERARRVVA